MALIKDSVVEIISDNDNYTKFIGRKLKITHASNTGPYYDDCLFPEMLCDLQDIETGEHLPFACYEYELETV